ncbi:hypothetical protein EVAR_6927_1 [Eumeta japonica]|uniref:Uncharacterized protein n=1 Tax=Eumeta variegata TaxID=151549 RepID=A0A4C1THH4_EUMVA|nr:hypothetical protein EVAR_6927_1 [Eumeta japonica]
MVYELFETMKSEKHWPVKAGMPIGFSRSRRSRDLDNVHSSLHERLWFKKVTALRVPGMFADGRRQTMDDSRAWNCCDNIPIVLWEDLQS